MVTIHPKEGGSPLWEDAPPLDRTIAELTRAHGHHPLAFFGLAPGVGHFLAPGGRGLVNYRLVNHTAVVLGDPLCAPEAVEPVTRGFLELCASYRWSVAFYQASAHFLAGARALNLRSLKIGEEAILSPQRFTLRGAALANVRTSCRRAEREGIAIQWYDGVPPEGALRQLAGVSRAWLRHKGGAAAEEMGFSVGKLADLTMHARRADWIAAVAPPSPGSLPVPSLVTGVAMTGAGAACAFVTFTPVYGGPADDPGARRGWGWALDLMRRDPAAPPGVMELLLAQAIDRFRRAGAATVSLGLVALADTRREVAPVERQLAGLLADQLAAFENRQTLFAFKQKFAPTWESRYLVASTARAWPKVALAVHHFRNYARGALARPSGRQGAREIAIARRAARREPVPEA